jgi:sec-independent protein translocase protein TatA
MPNIGPAELIVILVIALLVLGPKKLPEVGKSLGRGIREFKDSISSGDDDGRIGDAIVPHEPRRAPTQVAAAPQPVEPATPRPTTVDEDR